MSLVTWDDGKPRFKAPRGTAILDREKADRERLRKEREIAAAVKERDHFTCRWPEKHTCRSGLEAAHIVDKSLRGATETENEVSVCAWIHRRGPESIHGKQLQIRIESPAGADGPLSFWRRTDEVDALGQPVYYCIAVEVSRGVIRKD